MLQLLFGSGIALAIYLIFANIPELEPYAVYFFWTFIGVLILFGVVAIIKAVFAIKDTVTKGKTNAKKKQ